LENASLTMPENSQAIKTLIFTALHAKITNTQETEEKYKNGYGHEHQYC